MLKGSCFLNYMENGKNWLNKLCHETEGNQMLLKMKL